MLELYLDNLQIITNSSIEIFFQNGKKQEILNFLLISFNLIKKKIEDNPFASEIEKGDNDNYLIKASIIIHNICFFCYDEFNSRYSATVSESIKSFLSETQSIFEEILKFLFEVGIFFPNTNNKDLIITNVLFPIIVVSPKVN